MVVSVRQKSGSEKLVIFFTFLLILFTTTVQIFLVQWEIGLIWLFLPPTMVAVSTLVTNYWKCVWVDSSTHSLVEKPTVQQDGWRYCPYSSCAGSVPVNSRHCHQCDICVIQRDHHCHFTGRCIGQNNLPYFMVLISSLFALTLVYTLANIVYITTHETPGTMLVTILAPIQVLWYFLGYVTFSHCLISLNVVVSMLSLVGSIVLLYHEYMLLFHNKPYITKSMPVSSCVQMSRTERLTEVFGKKWYRFYLDPTHQTTQQRQAGVTKIM